MRLLINNWLNDDSFTEEVGNDLGHAVFKIEIGLCIMATIAFWF